MGQLKYLIIHCTDTRKYREVTGDEIRHWHTDPQPLGRGWSRVGYSDLIHLNGRVENLVEYDEDNWISEDEITNGAFGYNGISRHVCVVGGRDKDGNQLSKTGDFSDMMNADQFTALMQYITAFLSNHSDCQVLGHYQVNDHKECPGFDVPKFLRFLNIPEKHIYEDST